MVFAGKSDAGYGRMLNEDYVNMAELGNGDTYVAVIADGEGTAASFIDRMQTEAWKEHDENGNEKKKQELDPSFVLNNAALNAGYLAGNEVMSKMKRLYATNPVLLFQDPEFFLREAFEEVNRVYGAFQMSNEEKYGGFRASMMVLLIRGTDCWFAHAGNTRLYRLRADKPDDVALRMISRDHTEYNRLIDEGKIEVDDENVLHPEQYKVISGLGMLNAPVIDTAHLELHPKDLLLMTTDGVHYALTRDGMEKLVLDAGNCDEIVTSLIGASRELQYSDNCSAIAIWNVESYGNREKGNSPAKPASELTREKTLSGNNPTAGNPVKAGVTNPGTAGTGTASPRAQHPGEARQGVQQDGMKPNMANGIPVPQGQQAPVQPQGFQGQQVSPYGQGRMVPPYPPRQPYPYRGQQPQGVQGQRPYPGQIPYQYQGQQPQGQQPPRQDPKGGMGNGGNGNT